MSGNKHDDLLVFGYSCKLFRDDDKALAVDRGEYLIAWMGDDLHRIDRYDGRGALSNLKLHEAPEPHGFDIWSCLNEEEKRTEALCEEERYISLTQDDYDMEARKEETDKRSMMAGGSQIGFNYNQPSTPQAQPQLSLRALANCIEKTAEFILKHGAQMEIMMRAKEANNPKFQFLNPENPFNSIYKQVLETKKNRPKNYVANTAMLKQASLEVEQSLKRLTENLPSSAPALSGEAKPSSSKSTNAYSKLVEKIRENQPVAPSPPPPPPAAQETPKVEEPEVPKNVVEITPPPINMQPLIDRTASYVAKNGTDMLAMLKKYEAKKFPFLKEDDKYYLFFQYKVQLYKEMIAEKKQSNPSSSSSTTNGSSSVQAKRFPSLKGFF